MSLSRHVLCFPSRVLCTLLGLAGLFSPSLPAQTISGWVTSGDKSQLLQSQSGLSFGSSSNSTRISLDENTSYQTIDGFGFTLTEGSAEVIAAMASTQQSQLLTELFHPSSGSGISILRISIGASDMSSSSYSYNEVAGDVSMANFSLAGPDLTYLVPVLKKILAINPEIKILATPWTAPRWMKTNNGWIGGSLNSAYYGAYATYFVKYLDAMKSQGISIWAITPQNEPENGGNEPSMTMTANEQTTFINNNLGPAIRNAGYTSLKIICFDHNCDNTSYPTTVANGSSYVDGSAFHLYGGSISALSTVRSNTNKNVYFTEQYTGVGGSFSGDLAWHMQNVMLGSVNNWARIALEWNLATNASYGPRTPGGCSSCLGGVTISSSTSYSLNLSYYLVAQMSRAVKPNAVRIGSSTTNGGLIHSAFKNADGTRALVVFNATGGSSTFEVAWNGKAFPFTLANGAVASFKWTGDTTTIPVTGVSLSPASASLTVGATQQLTATVSPANATNKTVSYSTSNASVATVNASGLVTALAAGSATLTVSTQDGAKTATCAVTVSSSTVAVTGVSVNPSSASLTVGGSTQLSATVIPADATNKNVSWSSSNSAVATVSASGLVTAIAAGTATLTVTTEDGNRTATCAVTVTSGGTTNPVFSGYYNILSRNSGLGLDVAGNSTASGGAIQQYSITSGGGSNQRWSLEATTDGHYYLRPKSTAMYLSLASASTADGILVVQKSLDGSTTQKWDLVSLGAGYYRITNVYSGKSLDVQNVSTANGALIQVWTYGGGLNQQWSFVQVETGTSTVAVTSVSLSPTSASLGVGGTQQLTATVAPGNATNKAVSYSSSNAAVATVSSSGLVTALAAGSATITVTTADGAKTATCAVTVTGSSTSSYPGYYNLLARHSGLGLDVAGNATTSGAAIQQYAITSGGGANQRWRIDETGDGHFYIRPKSTQMYLSLASASTADGVMVVQKALDGSATQKWDLVSLGGGYYRITSVYSGKSLDVQSVSTANGALIQVWTYGGGTNQQWSFAQVETTK